MAQQAIGMSKEEVALNLLRLVAQGESIDLVNSWGQADREWVLKAYSDCLQAVYYPERRA